MRLDKRSKTSRPKAPCKEARSTSEIRICLQNQTYRRRKTTSQRCGCLEEGIRISKSFSRVNQYLEKKTSVFNFIRDIGASRKGTSPREGKLQYKAIEKVNTTERICKWKDTGSSP